MNIVERVNYPFFVKNGHKNYEIFSVGYYGVDYRVQVTKHI